MFSITGAFLVILVFCLEKVTSVISEARDDLQSSKTNEKYRSVLQVEKNLKKLKISRDYNTCK